MSRGHHAQGESNCITRPSGPQGRAVETKCYAPYQCFEGRPQGANTTSRVLTDGVVPLAPAGAAQRAATPVGAGGGT
jgi:hypothetical protein